MVKQINHSIVHHRQLYGFTVAELANAALIGRMYLHHMEAGIHYPSISRLEKIANVLEMPIRDMFTPRNEWATEMTDRMFLRRVAGHVKKLTQEQRDEILSKVSKLAMPRLQR